MKTITIGKHVIGPDQPVFIIAEIGINHNGSLELAKALIKTAAEAGCDAVKFQKRTVSAVFSQAELAKEREIDRSIIESALKRGVLPPESIRRLEQQGLDKTTNGDLKWALELTFDEYYEIDEYCRSLGIMWFASCWDEVAVDFINQFNPPAYKVASPCLTDDNLLRHTTAKGKPVIISTGMSNLLMVEHAVETLRQAGATGIAIMHCVSVYKSDTGETMLRRINLRALDTLQVKFDVPIGFSSHHNGIIPTHSAITRGASVVEHHITLNKALVGSDQAFSLVPKELQELCRWAREFPPTLGTGKIEIDPEEEASMTKLRRVWSPTQKAIYEQSKGLAS
ncbi:MAG: N-acetylneuraminate synthase [Parcubacteria group bacterium Gr01-1014_73]|nr:MAG: N-acetylneuraminate synthase [Parcubacteria group bacterium Gr01-1014_73]